MSRLILLLVIIEVRQVINVPLGLNGQPALHIKTSPHNIPTIVTSNNGVPNPVLVPIIQPHVTLDTQTSERQKKGRNIHLPLPLPHHLLVPTNLHVIPIHHSIHTNVNLISNNHVNLPVVSHTYSHGISNTTHTTSLIPYLIPIHTHLVPLHDLTVIPLHHVKPTLSHYRTPMDKKDAEENEPINKFRSFYGGYGNGLYIGGHGAGHGFYAYG